MIDYTDTFWKAFDYKILVDYERAKMFVHDKKMPNPRFSNMYITSSCNQNCQYCEYSRENQKSIIMPTDRVLMNIDEVNELGVKSIDFCGGGEPILHPGMDRILNHCHKKGIVVGLFTNLALKNDRRLENIVKCCSYIRISLDTFNEKKYNLIRRPKSDNCSFSVVIENIKKLIKFKKKNKSNIIIGTKALITKFNYKELEDFIKRSIDLGVDNIQFKKVSLFDEFYVRPEVEKAIADKFKRLREKYSGSIDILPNFQNLVLNARCFMHINHIFIDAFGDVFLCCYYLRRKSEHRIGNIYEKSIKDIWFGKRHWEAAKKIRIEECNRMDCRWIKFNNLMRPFVYEDSLRQMDFV